MEDMPRIGFGTARLRGEAGAAAFRSALACGYRHFDTARIYGNETVLGDVLAKAFADGTVAAREDLFITSKVLP
jgi:diketogulonate reductase-like aldo/keto reductase